MRAFALLLAVLAVAAARGDEAFHFVDRSGRPIVVTPESTLSGTPLLLHFWATWCPECVDDLGHLAQTASGCDRVRVMAVNAGDDADEVEKFLARHPTNLVVVRDPKGEVWKRVDGRGLPMNAVWSKGGAHTDVGPKTRDQWRALLASLGCPG